jgi:cell fate regulator YaaT (PSP1 superfamily)
VVPPDSSFQFVSMLGLHFVRLGVLGSVGRFTAAGRERYARGTQVVCRTRRGLEIGEVLSAAENSARDADHECDGQVLRRVTVEDNLLIARLEKNRCEAHRACTDRLAERGIGAILLDVEHLFDGRSLYFYFLGDTTPELDAVTTELAEVYEAKAQLQKFAETLTAGCGPQCGTEEGSGCGSGGCSTCAVMTACGSKQHS